MSAIAHIAAKDAFSDTRTLRALNGEAKLCEPKINSGSNKNDNEGMMLQHKHIDGTKFEIRGRDAAWKRTLVVMTNLTLDPAHGDYSAQAEAELLNAVTAYWKNNSTLLDAVNIRSTRVD